MISILSTKVSTAQQLNPPIQNYTSFEYSAASQNWDLSIDERGIIYSANNKGLLVFNGLKWKIFNLESGSIIRSVFAYKDRVYTGSYLEFGYWKRNSKGTFVYHSLKHLFKDIELSNEEFWGIKQYHGNIYFRSFAGLYKYNGEEIVKIESGVFTSMILFKDRLFVAKGRDGLFTVGMNDKLTHFEPSEIIKNTIADIIVHNKKLIVGSKDRLYQLDEELNQFELISPEVNDFISRAELNKLSSLSSNVLVVGTLKNGFLTWNIDTGKIQTFDRTNGLQNNTILSMDVFNGNLWLGLDNGIDRVEVESPINFYTDSYGELGTVYDMIKEEDHFFLASNTGVYYLDDEGLKLLKGAEGHSWNLTKTKNRIISNSNAATFQIYKDRAVALDNSTGSFESELSPNKDFWIGTYTGLAKLSDTAFTRFEKLDFPVKKIVFENERVLWAAHPYEGIYRISLSEDLKGTTEVYSLPSSDSLEFFNPEIYKINNQIAVYSNSKWYRYNSFLDKLEIFDELKHLNSNRLLEERNGYYWFINAKNNDLVYTDLKNQNLILPSHRLEDRLVKDYENIISTSDSIYYVTLKDGFAKLNIKGLQQEQKKVFIAKPYVAGLEGVKLEYDIIEHPDIAFEDAKFLTFDIGYPLSDSQNIQYRLIGNDTVNGLLDSGNLEFQNLSSGEYELQLQPISSEEDMIETFNFRVLPPWYLSTIMKIVYFLFFVCLITLIYWYNRKRLKKHRILIEQKFEKEHNERINRLEKERLMDEIDMKRKELANTTMIAAKKNEVLMEIQGELNKDKSKMNEYRLKNIMTKINAAIKNKDEWQVFETNFNEIHEDFFKDILEVYPALTSKDLKLCSYLKMNLTSKEIAPLMGISVRGVEVHRYRLRKKMDLDKNENLTNYLIKNF
ncbi:helix-turn-helix and ligand-binding sensor domain-containing protein [Zunongwangia sp. HGR-M22]|uniref:helix-turn-helix and ligand-binding sensor domain-containing protein n=1 Tax=Zunongwangia sp. HGR-M22 TaxID=3015168 RepID=UPI0022DE35C7|nr:histidine kinase [Zunongwangia sp. HGR-M22]WBL24983.1 histidine kinase [Zunongwangia sp. HGR-M22]